MEIEEPPIMEVVSLPDEETGVSAAVEVRQVLVNFNVLWILFYDEGLFKNLYTVYKLAVKYITAVVNTRHRALYTNCAYITTEFLLKNLLNLLRNNVNLITTNGIINCSFNFSAVFCIFVMIFRQK